MEHTTPHIFGVAANVYGAMRRSRASQAVVISGESGAGKTEYPKHILRYLTGTGNMGGSGGTVVPESGEKKDGGAAVEHKILDSNPVLEAFGNAKTARNNNSSRFGKYFEVEFDNAGKVIGGNMQTYLLEKSRVVGPNAGERNYHVFYQMCTGASPEEKARWKLDRASKFRYLTMNGCDQTVAGVDDGRDFVELKRALESVGISTEDIDGVFSAIAAVLNLGNVEFVPKKGVDDAAEVKNIDVIKTVAGLLHCPENALQEALEYRTMTSPSKRSSVYVNPCDIKAAQDARDALAKEVYGKVFN